LLGPAVLGRIDERATDEKAFHDAAIGHGWPQAQDAGGGIEGVAGRDEKGLSCLHFILHDQIENIHDNQLSLISEVTTDANVQFIVPVLRDKLPPDINPDQYKVLSLSQDDKLFC